MRSYPSTTKVFLKYGVCNCCGVNNSIDKVAKAQNIKVEELLRELNRQV